MPLAAGTRLGPYKIVGEVGAGGMGAVYRARDERLGRDVAVKVMTRSSLSPASFDRFRREARAASSLNHPNIVTIYEIAETGADIYIVMEFVDGCTVREVINRRPAMPVVTTIISQVAQALAVAHKAGIVHRDIKPENLMVRPDRYVKLLDFGLARLVADARADDATQEQTATGILVGTMRYMSPEQATGEPVGTPSDIFSLGLIMYEMATGQHPFTRDPALGVLRGIISERAIPPSHLNPEIPKPIEALILQMLHGNPGLRPKASEVAAKAQELPPSMLAGDTVPVAARGKPELVGRERARAELTAAFQSVASGHGMLVSVTGEPGIGKTALVEDFLDGLSADSARCRVARGRCSERLAGVEAYLPLLEMLDSLVQGPDGHHVAGMMRLLAPGWYSQITHVSSTDSSTARLSPDKTSSPERLKRELAHFLQEASRDSPLVLMLDNVHWIDLSSTDVLAYLTGRFDQARLLVVVCYRKPELLARQHPFASLKLDLESRGKSREISIGGLDRHALERFVALKFPGHAFPAEFMSLLHTKTEGTPLFVAEVLRYLRDKDVIIQDAAGVWRLAGALPDIARELPDSVRSLIQRQIDGLDDLKRRLLVCASVQGLEFDAAVVARALASDPTEVEETYDAIEQLHGLVRRAEERELPDGTPTLRYRFAHVLYQNALYRSLTPSRRMSLSAAVAEAIVHFYGEHNASLALELALLYEIARDFAGAADAFARAARNAVRVAAYQESVLLAQRGLKALKTLPDTLVRAQLELELQLVLGLALTATKGYAAPEVEQAYTRARMLCERADDPLKRFRVLDGLWRFYSVKPDLVTSTELAQQLLELAQRTNDTQLVAIAHCSFGTPSLHRGLFDDALDHMNQALALYDPQKYQHHIAITGADLGVRCHTWVSLALWLLGYADQAAAEMDLALTRAGAIKHPFSQAFAGSLCAWQHHFRRQPAVVRKYAEEALALSAEHSLGQWVPVGLILKGWALAEEGETAEGIKSLRSGLDLFERTGAELNRPHFVSMLAEAYARAGQLADAIRAIDDALVLVERNQDRYWKSELLRLKGDFLLALSGAEDDAERCFSEAVIFARSQKARLLELRAATSLCRLWKRQNRAAAQRDLNTIYSWFTEGHATRDLMEASGEMTEHAGLSEEIR